MVLALDMIIRFDNTFHANTIGSLQELCIARIG